MFLLSSLFYWVLFYLCRYSCSALSFSALSYPSFLKVCSVDVMNDFYVSSIYKRALSTQKIVRRRRKRKRKEGSEEPTLANGKKNEPKKDSEEVKSKEKAFLHVSGHQEKNKEYKVIGTYKDSQEHILNPNQHKQQII